MKRIALTLIFALPLVALAGEIRTGDSLGDVRAALGAPRGEAKVGNRQLLYYDRGEVELQAGAVTRVALLSTEDLAAREARRAADAARIREEQEILRAQLTSEGEAVKARMLANRDFLHAPPEVQVAFWQDFARRYPDVPSAELLAAARLQLAAWETIRARDEAAARVAELDSRLAAAEQRADEAPDRIYVSSGGGYYRHRSAATLWPIEYHFNNVSSRPLIPSTAPAHGRPGDSLYTTTNVTDDSRDRTNGQSRPDRFSHHSSRVRAY